MHIQVKTFIYCPAIGDISSLAVRHNSHVKLCKLHFKTLQWKIHLCLLKLVGCYMYHVD